ncbi:flagellar assembly protein FliW [Microbacterium sp. NPDC090007]|uniref:flagellar assembly protein FliW n=1 Tax=Microbacterium sp. NPDC090007 TaxID=3364204 RepID=UPI00380C4D43
MTIVPTLTGLDVEFVRSLPGLGPVTSFRLDRIEGADGLYALRAVAEQLRLFLVDAAVAASGYSPPVTDEMADEVGAPADELRVFVVANPSDEGVTLNLRAPVLIDVQSGRASQVILDDTSYPLRALLGSPVSERD